MVVVGAGAAGLAAALFAGETAEKSCRCAILLLDGAKTIGAKILISGGGRCNVTHETVKPTDFFGNRHIIKNVLAAFPVENTIKWFASLGVHLTREQTGKLFPVSNKARTVLNAVLTRCQELGVTIQTGHRVTGIDRLPDAEGGFAIHHSRGTLHARKVILATGGRSLPRTGSDGFGWELAKRLGHRSTETVPGLVPLVLESKMFHKTLSGLSHEVELTTVVGGKPKDRRTGSLLWTHFGISGPVVMDASRIWTLATARGNTVEVYANYLPGKTQEQTKQWFMDETARHPRRSLVHTLAQLLPERFGEAFCRHCGCDPQTAIGQLPRKDRQCLLDGLLRFRLPIERDRGWNYAEVTAGGIPLEEVNFRTMESKLVPGLYLVGEILDCDGRIGGFNFQWAWATGFLARAAAATSPRPTFTQR